MNRRHAFPILFAFLTVLSLSLYSQTPEEGKRLIPSDAKKLLKDLFGGDAKKSTAARERLLATRTADHGVIFKELEALAYIPPRDAPKPGRHSLQIATPEGVAAETPWILRVPKSYSARKPSPLLFRFHGSGDTAEAFDRNTNEDRAFEDFILVTPQIPSSDRMGWNQPGGHLMVDRLYTRVLKELNVDPQRIYFSGFSAGGGASAVFAETWPHRVAAIYSMGRTYHLLDGNPTASMAALTHIPGFFAIGLNDTKERVDGYRELENYFKSEKLNGIFHFVKGRDHELIQELNKPAIEFLLKAKRVVYPKSFRGIITRFSNLQEIIPITSRRYWIEVREYQQLAAVIAAAIEGQTITIDCPGLVRGSVLLNDALVDMDQHVKIVLNGKEVFSGAVERSPTFLLEWFENSRDRGELYWNRIDFRQQ